VKRGSGPNLLPARLAAKALQHGITETHGADGRK
jgi:hypothetical protein